MINRSDIAKVLKSYDQKKLRIACLGGHSALDICRGAKKEGFETVVVAQKGRSQTYSKYYKTKKTADGEKGCVDHVIEVDNFTDVTKPAIQKQLRDLNCLFVHSRYFWVYCNFDEVENKFLVPIVGNRVLVRKEERDETKNQYFLLKEAGVGVPKQFAKPNDIDRLVIVKAAEAARGYERAFFLVSSFKEYQTKGQKLVKTGTITQQSLDSAVIEEFVVGPQINFNYFYSPLDNSLELVGTDTRRQTNIDGLLRLTAEEQLEVLKYVRPKYIENGHQAVTVKESLVEKAYEAGEKFIKAVAEHYPPGMIGPFALQGAVTAGPPKEEFLVFDVSMRMPGSPGTMFTPYTGYMYGENMSVGQRIAKEINLALADGKLIELLT